MKRYAKICFETEGVIHEELFETEAEARAFVMGYNAREELEICHDDESHFAIVDDKPAEDES